MHGVCTFCIAFFICTVCIYIFYLYFMYTCGVLSERNTWYIIVLVVSEQTHTCIQPICQNTYLGHSFKHLLNNHQPHKQYQKQINTLCYGRIALTQQQDETLCDQSKACKVHVRFSAKLKQQHTQWKWNMVWHSAVSALNSCNSAMKKR